MANSAVDIKDAGDVTLSIDAWTDGDGNYRQAVVIADPTTTTAVAPVTAERGLLVDGGVVSTAHLIAAGSTNATVVKASAGRLRAVHAFNAADAPRHVKFHNTAGTPTAGTGVVLTVSVQAGTQRDFVLKGRGRAFTTGIALTTVTGIADNDTAAVTANDLSIEVEYE